MAEHADTFPFLNDLFPTAGPALLRLLHGAAENAYLLRTDFYTIRDWLEIADLSKEESAAALLMLMMTALEEGSLCIEIADAPLRQRLRDFVDEEEAAAWARRIVQAVESPTLASLIGSSPRDHKPAILHTIGSLRFVYFQKYLRAELDFMRDLEQRLTSAAEPSQTDWPAIMADAAQNQPLRLNREQKRALGLALCNNLTIISGGPGTGKTSIVLTLLRCLVRGGIAPDRIALAAPTGRAAQRLTDALRAGLERIAPGADVNSPDSRLRELAASTMHQLLGYRPSRNLFSRHRENPIPADVVIVDEVSMVGLVLMAQLLQALDPKTKLVLLGDKDQLPSVEAGAVLAHLVETEPDAQAVETGPWQERVALLHTNHRSQQAIREAAQAINRQDTSIVERLPGIAFPGAASLDEQAGCFLLEQTAGTAHELRAFLQHWADQAYFHSKLAGKSLAEWIDGDPDDADAPQRFEPLFALLDRFRLLTLVRESAWGCDEINTFFEQYLRPKLDADTRPGLFAGAPVLITRNDSARGLYNGDVGITLHSRGGLRVVFARHEGVASFPAEALPPHELGFALTVHKSQGSEYANVMLVVPPKGARRLLTKELIYTAITRAKSLAVLCAAKDVLKSAIGRRIVRESGVLRAIRA